MTAKDARSRVLWNRIPESIKKGITKAIKNDQLDMTIELPYESKSYESIDILTGFGYLVKTLSINNNIITLLISW